MVSPNPRCLGDVSRVLLQFGGTQAPAERCRTLVSAETDPFPIISEILVSIWDESSEQHHWEVAAAGDGPGLSAGAGQ